MINQYQFYIFHLRCSHHHIFQKRGPVAASLAWLLRPRSTATAATICPVPLSTPAYSERTIASPVVLPSLGRQSPHEKVTLGTPQAQGWKRLGCATILGRIFLYLFWMFWWGW